MAIGGPRNLRGKGQPTGLTVVRSAVRLGSNPAGSAPAAGLAMTQLTAGQIYQRTTKTGGGAGKGAGSIVVPITLSTAANTIEYRLRDAIASGNPVVKDWVTVGVNVSASATSITCPNIPADARQYLLDLRANSDPAQIVLGTSLVMMGRLIAASGQSQMVRQFILAGGYVGTNSSLGVAVSPYCGVYGAVYNDGAGGSLITPVAWAQPSMDGTAYGSTFPAEFLRRQIAASGVACGLVGACQGSTYISDWAPGSADSIALRAVLDAVGGFEAFYWHQGGQDAGNNTALSTYKSALDSMFADINQHNAAWGSGYTKLLTAMATRTSSGAGSISSVQTIRQAQKQWAAANNAVYLEPHDLTLADGAVHQDQPGNITLAQHAHRALLPSLGLAGNDTGPTLGTPSRASGSATVYVPVTLPSGATKLVLTGNAYKRLTVYPSGTLANAISVSALSYDATNTRLVLTLASTPADSQALDVYAFVHPDPGSTDYLNDMIRDDRVDGDGITVGRSLEPSTAGPVTCPAIASSSPPANQTAPAITGTPQVGQTLTSSQGTWSNSPTSYAYQWNRAGSAISGATASTYSPVAADVGNTLTVTVTATNASGSASATSTATAAVTAASGAAKVSQLNIMNGTDYAGNNSAWNDVDANIYTGGTAMSLKDPNGNALPWTATYSVKPANRNNYGVTGSSATNGVPDSVAQTALYIDTGSQTSATLHFAGLDATKTYKVQTYSSRSGSGSPARTTNITCGGGSSTVNAYGNAGLVTIATATPNSDGTMDLVMSQGASTQYAYLNAVVLSQN